jgi:hypothetical protein
MILQSFLKLSLWTAQEDQECLAHWRCGATSSSAIRQDVGRRQMQRL